MLWPNSIFCWVNLSPCLTSNELLRNCVWWRGFIDTSILDLSTRWDWVISFISRQLYSRYPQDKRLDWQNRSGWRGEKKILAPTWARTPNPLSDCDIPHSMYGIPPRINYKWTRIMYPVNVESLNTWEVQTRILFFAIASFSHYGEYPWHAVSLFICLREILHVCRQCLR
jgi:hypothetical protein